MGMRILIFKLRIELVVRLQLGIPSLITITSSRSHTSLTPYLFAPYLFAVKRRPHREQTPNTFPIFIITSKPHQFLQILHTITVIQISRSILRVYHRFDHHFPSFIKLTFWRERWMTIF